MRINIGDLVGWSAERQIGERAVALEDFDIVQAIEGDSLLLESGERIPRALVAKRAKSPIKGRRR